MKKYFSPFVFHMKHKEKDSIQKQSVSYETSFSSARQKGSHGNHDQEKTQQSTIYQSNHTTDDFIGNQYQKDAAVCKMTPDEKNQLVHDINLIAERSLFLPQSFSMPVSFLFNGCIKVAAPKQTVC